MTRPWQAMVSGGSIDQMSSDSTVLGRESRVRWNVSPYGVLLPIRCPTRWENQRMVSRSSSASVSVPGSNWKSITPSRSTPSISGTHSRGRPLGAVASNGSIELKARPAIVASTRSMFAAARGSRVSSIRSRWS